VIFCSIRSYVCIFSFHCRYDLSNCGALLTPVGGAGSGGGSIVITSVQTKIDPMEVVTTSCDSGDGCTVGDTCSAGVCMSGIPKDCSDTNPCSADTCEDGTCVNRPLVGLGCDDVGLRAHAQATMASCRRM
jgi:hypothetical protein